MKKIIAFILSLTIIAAFAACGAEPDAEKEAVPPQGMTSVLPGAGAAEAAAQQNTADSEKASPADTAKSMIGCDISELIEVIGEPVSSEYAKSCMGSGDDGELHYDGFTVYTNRTDSGEIIQNVE